MKTTITEALAEIKTIGKRLDKKEFVTQYALRQEMVKDPLAKDGGSEAALAAAMQSIKDLQKRVVAIRSAIQLSNLATTLTIGEKAQCVTNWLTWRKEIAPGEQKFLQALRLGIEQERARFRTKGVTVGAASVEMKPTDVVVNVDEGQLAKDAEQLEETLGVLDGKLSLLNATTFVELD